MSNLQTDHIRIKSDDERVRDFQRKIYSKAKREADFRFYVLYDKVRSPYFLSEAYRRCRKNGGSAGVDGMTFEQIEKDDVETFLEGIAEELASKTYKASPVKRVYIEKANGKLRPLGIPTIKDRVVQQSCRMVIEPIFEADFEEDSYGFRPKRGAHDAVRKIAQNLKDGLTEVYDADLTACFDTIPHKELLKLVGKRISDRNVLHLIKMWLKAPINEDGKISGGKGNKVGTPQGGVISPLLANIYINLIDKAVNRVNGMFAKFGIKIIRYADDFILMAEKMRAESLHYLEGCLEQMKLVINKEKTHLADAKRESFDFLGFTFRYDRDLFGRNKQYWNIFPRKKARQNIRDKVKQILDEGGHLPPKILAVKLNQCLKGWIQYFSILSISYPQEAKRDLYWFLKDKLFRYYRRKSQRHCQLHSQGAYDTLVSRYGLIEVSTWQRPRTL